MQVSRSDCSLLCCSYEYMLGSGGVFNGDAMGKFGPASHRADIPLPRATILNKSIDSPSTGQGLDIKQAVFKERLELSDTISVEQRWYAHASRPSLLVHEIAVSNTGSGPSKIVFNFDYSNSSSDLDMADCPGLSNTEAGVLCVLAQNKVPEDAKTKGGGNHTTLALVNNDPCGGASSCAIEFARGQTTLTLITAIVSSLNSSEPVSDALTIHQDALKTSATLLREHVDAWSARWGRGSLQVHGDTS